MSHVDTIFTFPIYGMKPKTQLTELEIIDPWKMITDLDIPQTTPFINEQSSKLVSIINGTYHYAMMKVLPAWKRKAKGEVFGGRVNYHYGRGGDNRGICHC